MCDQCGCRESQLIGQLTAEHTEIDRVAGQLQRAVMGGRHAFALQVLEKLLGLLTPHASTEECLFAQLPDLGGLAEPVAQIRADHKDIWAVLDGMDRTSPDWPATLFALHRLRRHIAREERDLLRKLASGDIPVTAAR